MSQRDTFDWAAFEAALARSTALCAQGKADVSAAIAAGLGKPAQPAHPKPRPGQVWISKAPTRQGVWVLAAHPTRNYFLKLCDGGSWLNYESLTDSIEIGQLEFAANSLAEYVAGGGKL